MDTLESVKKAEKEAEKISASADSEKHKLMDTARKKTKTATQKSQENRLKYRESEMKNAEKELEDKRKKLLSHNEAELSKLKKAAAAKADEQLKFLVQKFKDAVHD